jgi:hypothetical protein
MSVVANVAINVDAANAIQQLNRVKTATDAGQKSLVGASTAAKGLGTALAAALGPIIGVTTAIGALGKAMQVFQDRQTDIAVLRNGLTGLVDDVAGVSEGLRVMADEFGKVTLFSEEDFMKGAQMLTSFRDIAVSSYQEVIGVAGDVAQVMGTDVNSSLLQLAKALQDPVAGLTALSRSGIQFNESQKETIKSMVEAGNAAGAQALILGELKTQYGGAAAAAGSAGFAGAMDTLAERTNDAFEILGKALDPALKAGVDLISAGVQTLADWWSYLGAEVFPKVQAAVQPVVDALRDAFEGIDFDVIRVAIQSILIGGMEAAIGIIKDFSNVLAIVINGFKELSQNPVFQFIAEQVGNLATMLGLTNDKVGEYKKKQEEAADAAKDAVNEAVNLSKATEEAALSAEELKKKQQEVTKAIQDSVRMREQAAKVEEALIDQRLKTSSAYLQTEQSITGILLEQKERQLENVKTFTDRLRLINEIYDLTKQQAQLEYEATMANIEAEYERGRLAALNAQQKQKEVEAIVLLAKAQGTVNDNHYAALQSAKESADLAQIQANTLTEVARQQERSAEAVLKGRIEVAEAERKQQLTAFATERAASASGTFAKNMSSVASSAAKAAGDILRSTETVTGGRIDPGAQFGEAGRNRAFMAEYAEAFNKLQQDMLNMGIRQAETASRDMMDTFMQRAEEYNRAVAAEANQRAIEAWNKYVPGPVGTSSMRSQIGTMSLASAMARPATGLNPQVNISTGPVMQMDGTNYVTMNDLQQATSTAARQGANLALSQLQSNPTVRRQIGVAR